MQFLVSLKCRFCETVVMEKTMPQEDAMKSMNVTYSKRGTPRIMGKLIAETVDCPGCHLPVVVPTGLGRGLFASFSLTSVPSAVKKVEEAGLPTDVAHLASP